MSHHNNDAEIAESEQKIEKAGVKPGQRYRHTVTGNTYVILNVGLFEGDLEPMVSYRRDDQSNSRIWFRYMSIFFGRVIHAHTLVPRFTLVEE